MTPMDFIVLEMDNPFGNITQTQSFRKPDFSHEFSIACCHGMS